MTDGRLTCAACKRRPAMAKSLVCCDCVEVPQLEGVDADQMLSTSQARMLLAVYDLHEANGYPPSMRELGVRVGCRSTNNTAELLSRLARKGYVRRVPMVSRALRVEPLGRRWLRECAGRE